MKMIKQNQIKWNRMKKDKKKQGLCRTRKLRQCKNLKVNLRIYEPAKASNIENCFVQLVSLADLVKLICLAGSMHIAQCT